MIRPEGGFCSERRGMNTGDYEAVVTDDTKEISRG
jgi:hypothetical protein